MANVSLRAFASSQFTLQDGHHVFAEAVRDGIALLRVVQPAVLCPLEVSLIDVTIRVTDSGL